METIALFEEKVPITPRDLSRDTINVDELLRKKLATKLEGRCSLHGWVKPSSMKILSRSMGYVEKGRFTGDIVYHVLSEGSVVNPPSGAMVVGEVVRKNKMGMYINYNDAIRIILPRDLHLGDKAYDELEIGERVNVEIKKSRFQVNDEYILSVGLFQGRVSGEGSYKPPTQEAKVEEKKEEEEDEEEDEEDKDTLPALEKDPVTKPTVTDELVFDEEEEEQTEQQAQPQSQGQSQPQPQQTVTTGGGNEETSPIEFHSKSGDYTEFTTGWIAPFTVDGQVWKSVEHYYQAMKFPSDPAYQEQIRSAPTPAKAKVLGATQEKPARVDWDTQKDVVMKKALRAKFTDSKNQALLQKLLATYNHPLVDANASDSYWGAGRTKKGKNRLGLLLMELRSAIRAERGA